MLALVGFVVVVDESVTPKGDCVSQVDGDGCPCSGLPMDAVDIIVLVADGAISQEGLGSVSIVPEDRRMK